MSEEAQQSAISDYHIAIAITITITTIAAPLTYYDTDYEWNLPTQAHTVITNRHSQCRAVRGVESDNLWSEIGIGKKKLNKY